MKRFRRSYKRKRIKPIFSNRFFRVAVVVLLLGSSAFYLINFHSFLQVQEINISGSEKVSVEKIEEVVQIELEKKILSFSSKSILLADFNGIKKQVLNNFPQVGRVDIKRKLPHTLNIIVTEKSGVAVWRQADKNYLLDKMGIVFEKAGENELLKIESLIVSEKSVLGANVISKERLDQLLKIEKSLTEADILLLEALIVSPQRLDIKTVAGWEIYFNIQEDIDWQITEFLMLLEKHVPIEDRENLEYVDLRFEKVYYKFKALD